MSDLADRWLNFAREDLNGATLMLREGIYNLACFHAQQCVEKALKGALVSQGKASPRVHAVAELLALLPDTWLTDLRADLANLDNYYIPTRYPDALPGSLPESLPGQLEAIEALHLARTVFHRVMQSLQ